MNIPEEVPDREKLLPPSKARRAARRKSSFLPILALSTWISTLIAMDVGMADYVLGPSTRSASDIPWGFPTWFVFLAGIPVFSIALVVRRFHLRILKIVVRKEAIETLRKVVDPREAVRSITIWVIGTIVALAVALSPPNLQQVVSSLVDKGASSYLLIALLVAVLLLLWGVLAILIRVFAGRASPWLREEILGWTIAWPLPLLYTCLCLLLYGKYVLDVHSLDREGWTLHFLGFMKNCFVFNVLAMFYCSPLLRLVRNLPKPKLETRRSFLTAIGVTTVLVVVTLSALDLLFLDALSSRESPFSNYWGQPWQKDAVRWVVYVRDIVIVPAGLVITYAWTMIACWRNR